MPQNENAIVNTEPTTSETPSSLVAQAEKPTLSPNPYGSGFTSQQIVNSLPSQENAVLKRLYLVPVYNEDGTVRDYTAWTYTLEKGYVRVYTPAIPELKAEDGVREQQAKVQTPPRPAPEKIFNGEVVFNEEPTIKGKKLHDWIDSEGGVTQEELDTQLALKANLNGANFTGAITAPSIIEDMSGYSFSSGSISSNVTLSYAGCVKNGNKLTFVIAGNVSKASGFTTILGTFIIPDEVANKIFTITGNYVAIGNSSLDTSIFSSGITKRYGIEKISGHNFVFYLFGLNTDLADDTPYMFRIEATFLLSDNLAS